MIVLHYTGMDSGAAALARLTAADSKVSAHYMIDEDGTIYGLVPEEKRAWHAGVSCWAGERDINGVSIGIELVNPGHAYPGYVGGYRPFPDPQYDALLNLLDAIRTRHDIPDAHILAHSDVAPSRKQDPGELFDWERLAAAGHGLMPRLLVHKAPGTVRDLQDGLIRFGYDLTPTGLYDAETDAVVTAFQRHYRRTLVNGEPDNETWAVLYDLLDQIDY